MNKKITSNYLVSDVIHVNVSSTFVIRAKCRHCHGGPKYYWNVRTKTFHGSINIMRSRFASAMKNNDRICSDFYMGYQPRVYHGINSFSFQIDFNKYPARLHKNKGVPSYERTEMLECECGKTLWAFNEKSAKNRPEISQRKSRYKYPQGFQY